MKQSLERNTVKSRMYALVGLMSLLVAEGCSSGPKIVGTVRDFVDRPLPGVVVSIDGSAFRATTDSAGKYEIEYAPGEVHLTFTKDNTKDKWQPETLVLKLATATKFPAADIKLFPIPFIGLLIQDGQVLAGHVNDRDVAWTQANPHGSFRDMRRANFQKRGDDPYGLLVQTHEVWSIDASGLQIRVAAHRPFQLVQGKESLPVHLVRVGNDAQLADYWTTPASFGAQQNVNFVPDDVQEKSQIRIHSASLGTGIYAYVPMQRVRDGRDAIVGGGSIIAFEVK
jgi:hypothetical protein